MNENYAALLQKMKEGKDCLVCWMKLPRLSPVTPTAVRVFSDFASCDKTGVERILLL